MKAKTARFVLRRKFDDFLASIDDLAVRALVEKNTIITGGSIASMLLGEKVNDFDLYFRNKETVLAVAGYYAAKFAELNPVSKHAVEIREDEGTGRVRIFIKSAGIIGEETESEEYRYFETDPDPTNPDIQGYVEQAVTVAEDAEAKPSYRPVFFSSNAITLSDKIQLVVRFYGEPEEIHRNYDFVHCTNYWCSWDNKLELHKDALQSLLAKELRYTGSLYPLCSIIRTRKFIARGWTINAGQFLKMCMQVSELNLSDLNVLEDQLVGVDAAYFMQIITMLKENMGDDGKIDYAYLIEIIDRVF